MEPTQAPQKIVMYGTPVCPMVPPMKSLLNGADVDYDYVNIHDDSAARDRVKEINSGYESVPTFEFPDGTTLTEPSTRAMKHKLETMGYTIPLTAMVIGTVMSYWWMIFVLLGIGFAVLRAFGIF